jgi:RND family efflux transporter MFP subunit
MNLSFLVGGVVSAVFVDEGARVGAGQLLARLDPTEIAANVRQAREALKKAKRDFERANYLNRAGQATPVELQNSATALEVARAALAAARFNRQHSVISAPEAGWIDKRRAEAGEVVGAGQPIFHFSGRGQGWVARIALSDREVLGLEPGRPARVRLDIDPARVHSARISEVARSASPATGTFDVEVALDELGADLRAGFVAEVEIDQPSPAKARVPLAALVQGHGLGASVFVLDGERARRVPVQLVFFTDEIAALATALEGNDVVITEGSASLSDGSVVAVAAGGTP